MKVPSKLSLIFSMLVSALSGVALAAYEVNNLNRVINSADSIADAIAAGLGGIPAGKSVTVTASLCFGLIPLGRVENPQLVIAIGDFILGALITGCGIFLVYTLREAFSRDRADPLSNDGLF
jgi:hypothetical protein